MQAVHEPVHIEGGDVGGAARGDDVRGGCRYAFSRWECNFHLLVHGVPLPLGILSGARCKVRNGLRRGKFFWGVD